MGEPRGHCTKLNNPDTGEKKKKRIISLICEI